MGSICAAHYAPARRVPTSKQSDPTTHPAHLPSLPAHAGRPLLTSATPTPQASVCWSSSLRDLPNAPRPPPLSCVLSQHHLKLLPPTVWGQPRSQVLAHRQPPKTFQKLDYLYHLLVLAGRGSHVQDVVKPLGSRGQRCLGGTGPRTCVPVTEQERMRGQGQVLAPALPAEGAEAGMEPCLSIPVGSSLLPEAPESLHEGDALAGWRGRPRAPRAQAARVPAGGRLACPLTSGPGAAGRRPATRRRALCAGP